MNPPQPRTWNPTLILIGLGLLLPGVACSGSTPPSPDRPEETPTTAQLNEALRTAVLAGDAAAIPALAKKGANVEIRWKWGESLLMRAASNGDLPVVAALLSCAFYFVTHLKYTG